MRLDKGLRRDENVDDTAGGINVWDRTGTVLSPHTSGDSIESDGGLKVGEILELAPLNGETDTTKSQTIDYVVHDMVHHDDADWHELFLNGTSTQMIIPHDTAWGFNITIVGTSPLTTEYFMYTINGLITRDASNNTTLQASNVTVISESDANFNARVAADDTTEALIVEVTDAGSTGDYINWTAKVDIVTSTHLTV